ncbi:MAG TPA: DUF2975 domain-containing protein [Caulobacteraceae bacterium]|jgi:hypothetical protein
MTPADYRSLAFQSRLMCHAATFVFVCMAALVLLVLLTRHRVAGDGPHLLIGVIQSAPSFCYLWALWAIRRTFAQIARGVRFDAVIPHLLAQVGAALFVGAVLQVVVVTNLMRLVAGPRHGAFLHYEPAAIVLGVVGASLFLLTRLLRTAGAMKAELDEII